jgi:hypothetical protein
VADSPAEETVSKFWSHRLDGASRLPFWLLRHSRSNGEASSVARMTGGSNAVFSDRFVDDSLLEGDGFELSVKIRPEENCGFPGPRHQDNSTPNRGEIVSKKGARASHRLIPSRTRDTAPFICLGTGCHCSTQSGSLRSLCRHSRHCIGRRGIAMKSHRTLLRSVL